MAIINCSNCGKRVSDAAPSCIHCGHLLSENDRQVRDDRRPKIKRNTIIFYAVILLVILVLYEIIIHQRSNKEYQNTDNTEITGDSTLSKENHEDMGKPLPLHSGHNYKIVNAEPFKPSKCIIHVRIPGKLSKDQIQDIAQQIRIDYPSYKRLLIFYFLPDVKFTDGAWATSHYDTELKIEIIGNEGEKGETTRDNKTSLDILGNWYCNTPGVKHKITFFKDGNNLKAKLVWPFDYESIESIREGRNGKYIITSSKFGEYYILNSSNILELWDRDGKYGIATKK